MFKGQLFKRGIQISLAEILGLILGFCLSTGALCLGWWKLGLILFLLTVLITLFVWLVIPAITRWAIAAPWDEHDTD